MKTATLASFVLCLCSNAIVAIAASLDLSTVRLAIDERAVSGLTFADGTRWPPTIQPAFCIESGGRAYPPRSVDVAGNRWTVQFANNATAEFRVTCGRGFALFRLTKLAPRDGVTCLQPFTLAAPPDARLASTLNAAVANGHFAAVMAAEPNVNAELSRLDARRGDRAGCRHEFVPSAESKAGHHAARFTATCNEQPGGWSVQGQTFPTPRNLTGCKAIRAWVHGDGNGEALKIQLCDDVGGFRDNYLTIDFKGWRQVTLTQCPINTLRYDQVRAVSFYYNSMLPNKTVTCFIAQVEAVVAQGGKERTGAAGRFRVGRFPLVDVSRRSAPCQHLQQTRPRAGGVRPARLPRSRSAGHDRAFRVGGRLAASAARRSLEQTVAVDQTIVFLPDRLSRVAVRRGPGAGPARRFSHDSVGPGVVALGTGHYQINRDRFPDGLEGLKRTLQRFRSAGFRVGLHFLGASIYPPDSYLVPVPDRRLVTGAAAALTADIDEKATFLPLDAVPEGFPAEDGSYEGRGTVVRVGDELISYGKRSLTAPFGVGRLPPRLPGHPGGGA